MLSLHGPRVGVFFESGLLIKAWCAHGGVCVCVCVCVYAYVYVEFMCCMCASVHSCGAQSRLSLLCPLRQDVMLLGEAG